MANQSAKKNQKNIKLPVLILTYLVYGSTAWLVIWNIYYFMSQQISIFHLLLCSGLSYINIYCFNTIVNYMQLQATEAAQYHIDILAMNIIVSIFDPITHYIWHVYWCIALFVLYFVGKWLWAYITPKFQEVQQVDQSGKKLKKEKREKIKYLKK